MVITLNLAEQKLATYVGRSRYETCRKLGVKNLKVGDHSNEDTEVQGVGGELAFCRAVNIYPDLDTASAKDADCILPGGIKIDVKATPVKDGRLLVPPRAKGRVHAYALVIGWMPEFRIAGWFPSEKVFEKNRLTEINKRGSVYAVRQIELYPIELLLNGEYKWNTESSENPT